MRKAMDFILGLNSFLYLDAMLRRTVGLHPGLARKNTS